MLLDCTWSNKYFSISARIASGAPIKFVREGKLVQATATGVTTCDLHKGIYLMVEWTTSTAMLTKGIKYAEVEKHNPGLLQFDARFRSDKVKQAITDLLLC